MLTLHRSSCACATSIKLAGGNSSSSTNGGPRATREDKEDGREQGHEEQQHIGRENRVVNADEAISRSVARLRRAEDVGPDLLANQLLDILICAAAVTDN
eukprot:scaffold84933_cov55-Phaeocystis_antarctica.AAC.5